MRFLSFIDTTVSSLVLLWTPRGIKHSGAIDIVESTLLRVVNDSTESIFFVIFKSFFSNLKTQLHNIFGPVFPFFFPFNSCTIVYCIAVD